MFVDDEVEVVPVEGFDDYYVSRDGRVWSTKGKGRWLVPTPVGKGYLAVCLCRDGHSSMKKVHRLVAEAFCSKPESNEILEVDHIDNDKTNNRADNLQWLSHADNVRKSKCKPLLLYDTLSGSIERFDSQKDAAAFLGCSQPMMSKMVVKPQIEYLGWCVLATKDDGGDWLYNKDRLTVGSLLGLMTWRMMTWRMMTWRMMSNGRV